MTGRLIAIEGLDGVGKTTVAQALAEKLGALLVATAPSELFRYTGGLDEHLQRSPAAHQLFHALAVAAVSDRIRPHVDGGADVVVDAYWFTTVAYGEAVRRVRMPLFDVRRRLVRPTCTVWLEAERDVRFARLRRSSLHGTTPDSHTTLVPAVERRLLARYENLLTSPFAGRVIRVRTEGATVEVVANVLAALAGDAPPLSSDGRHTATAATGRRRA